MTDAPRPGDIENADDVGDLFSTVHGRDINHLDMPDGQTLWIHFTEQTYYEDYRLEINFHSRNLWLHHESDDGTDTVWKNKRY